MSRRPFERRVYWNEPTMNWWESMYIFEIVRGLSVTGRVFTRSEKNCCNSQSAVCAWDESERARKQEGPGASAAYIRI